MIVAPSNHCCKSLVEVYGHYTVALNSSKLMAVVSFLDEPDNQDCVSDIMIKVILVAEECRMEQHVRPVVEGAVVVGTGAGVVVVLATGVGIEMPFSLVLELVKPC